MSFVEQNTAYEEWMRTACDVVDEDLELKHERMSKNTFKFLRATFFRWPHTVETTDSHIMKLPAPLAVGDAHVENFGTWRDAEFRPVWGINDHDDAAEIPYASDILRLAVSTRLAGFGIGNREAAQAIFEGYSEGLNEPGPTLLDQKEMWMRDYVAVTDEQRKSFWDDIDGYTDAKPTDDARSALLASQPKGAKLERFASASKGGGSLGRPRYVATAQWRGGRIAREAKALLSSGWDWAAGHPERPSRFDDAVNLSTTAPESVSANRPGVHRATHRRGHAEDRARRELRPQARRQAAAGHGFRDRLDPRIHADAEAGDPGRPEAQGRDLASRDREGGCCIGGRRLRQMEGLSRLKNPRRTTGLNFRRHKLKLHSKNNKRNLF